MMQLPKGYTLQSGKYQLTGVIGQGGFGITYLGVWNTEVKGELGKVKTAVPVCIKEYFFKDYCYRDETTQDVRVHSEVGRKIFEKFKEKLIKEATILSDVHHPYIVNVLEVFEEHQTAYIAMEYIEGCSLKYMLDQQGVLSEKRVLKYVSQIGQALDFVHKKSIVHLDIKPSNILIDKKDTARLIDFGVSKRYDIEQQETSTTMLALSKGFASIEQYDDEGTMAFSACPDIYSLGATMYNLLCGEIPTESILRATKSLVKPRELNKELSEKTEEVILKAMSVKPIMRYQSVSEMLSRLELPSYFEESDNTLLESFESATSSSEEETDLVSATSTNSEDEQTLLKSVPKEEKIPSKKRVPFRLRFILLFLFFFFFGYHLLKIFKMNNADTSQEQSSIIPAKGGEDISIVLPATNEPQKVPLPPTEKKREKEVPERVSSTANQIKQRDTVTIAPEQDTIEEALNASFVEEMAAGEALMAQERYAEAKIRLMEAKKIRVTEELLRLIISCDGKIEEEEVLRRKALYEEMMSFGQLVIVKKKSSGRYGAIDTEGRERIKCVYLSVAPSGSVRAFEREDHLFDIYNNNGINVGQGLTNY